MKKILILLILLMSNVFVFADTIYVLKHDGWIKIEGVTRRFSVGPKLLKNYEYYLNQGKIFYKINNELYCSSMFEIEHMEKVGY